MKLFLCLFMSCTLLVSCSPFYMIKKDVPKGEILKETNCTSWEYVNTNYHLVAHVDSNLIEMKNVQFDLTTNRMRGEFSEFAGKQLYYYELALQAETNKANRNPSDSYLLTQQIHFYFWDAIVQDSTHLEFDFAQVSRVDIVDVNKKVNKVVRAAILIPVGIVAGIGLFVLLMANGWSN
jgi:hypothetical protein